jgi:hypothetical protein
MTSEMDANPVQRRSAREVLAALIEVLAALIEVLPTPDEPPVQHLWL